MNTDFSDIYKSCIRFVDNSIQDYIDTGDLAFAIKDISDTSTYDNGCGFKSSEILYLTISNLKNNNGYCYWNILKNYCLNFKNKIGDVYYYEAIEVTPISYYKFVKSNSTPISISITKVINRCKIIKFDFRNSYQIEYYNYREKSVEEWTNEFRENKGTLILNIQDTSSDGKHILFFNSVVDQQEGFKRYKAFILYITFHNLRYHGYRVNDMFGTLPQMHFSFHNTNEFTSFSKLVHDLFKKYIINGILYVGSYHYKYTQYSFRHPQLNPNIF